MSSMNSSGRRCQIGLRYLTSIVRMAIYNRNCNCNCLGPVPTWMLRISAYPEIRSALAPLHSDFRQNKHVGKIEF